MLFRFRKYMAGVPAIAVIALGVLIAAYPIIFRDKVPMSPGATLSLPPWQGAQPAGFEDAPSPDAGFGAAFYPGYAFLSDSAQRGDSVLWTPLEGGGLPFLALWRSRCLSPFSLPFYFLPTHRAIQLSFMLKLLVAGLCAYYAARKFGFDPPLAAFVGVTFQLSAHVFLWSVRPLADSVIWLPFVLLFAERLVLGQARYWPFGAIAFALMLLGGSPESAGVALLLVVVYFFLRILLARERANGGPAVFISLIVAAVAGVGLAALQILPAVELAREAATFGESLDTGHLRITDLVVAVFPHFFGKVPGAVSRGSADAGGYLVALLHVGWAPLLALPLWFAMRRFTDPRQRERIEAALLTCFVMILLAIVVPPLLAGVPFLRWIGPQHFLVGNAFLFGLIAAATALEWIDLDAEECQATLKRLVVIVPLIAILGPIAVFVFRGHFPAGTPAPVAQACAVALMCFALLALVVGTMFRPTQHLMGYSLAALAFANLFFAFHPGVAFTKRDQLFPDTPFIKSLKERGDRVSGSDTLDQWPLNANLVPQLHATSGTSLKRYAAFLEKAESDPLLLRRTGSPALLLTKSDIQTTFAPVRVLLRIRRVFESGAVLFDDLEAKPRAWMAYAGRRVVEFDPDLLRSDRPPLMEGVIPPRRV